MCKLFITAGDGTLFIATGFIVGSPDGHGYHVLTAGHCAYIHDYGGWIQSITIVPAYDEGYAPFWVAYAEEIRIYGGWYDYQYPEYDIALITIDRNVGDYTGWMGIATADSTDSIYSSTLHTAGYPGDLYSGEKMYWSSELGFGASEYIHYYYLDTYGGQSGSPVWNNDTGPTVLSVHAYGSSGANPNMGVRINNEKYTDLIVWLNEDTPPPDYANLIDRGESYAGFTPLTIGDLNTEFTVWSSESNIGTASTGGYNVTYRASSDTTFNS
ncbi:MAG: trypsin-like serine peptidase, partial [Promethearchaeota archaeon]